MSISFVGAQGAASTTVTIPTHQSGDMILIFAYRDGSNTAPTVPTAGGTVPTWTLIGTSGGNTNSSRFHRAVATGSTTTSGTWTNATELICLVYRGTALVGASAGGSGSATTTISYPALTLQRTDNSSWVVGVAGHRTATNVEQAPSGMTNRASSGTEAAGHDTDGTVSSWSNQNVTVNASSAFRSWTVELRDATVVLTAEKGTFTETGIDAGVNHDAEILGSAGSFTYTGNAATLSKTTSPNKVLIADKGTFTETGIDAGLRHTARLTADAVKFFLAERNMRLWSESFDNATWTKSQASITPNATTAPDGTLTADALIENTTPSTSHRVTQNITYATERTYTASCYFKLYPGPITRYARLQLGGAAVFGTDTYININLATGTISATVGSPSASGITNEGNGWYRAWLTKQYTGTGVTTGPAIQIISTAGTALYTDADGLSGIYIWGAQFEEGSLSDYDPTGPVAAARTDVRATSVLTAEKGTFIETGVAADIRHTAILVAEKGTYTLAGNNADLHYVAGVDLNGNVGQFLATGNAATLQKTWKLVAATRAFNVNGISVNIVYAGNVINDNHHYYQIQETDPRKIVMSGHYDNGQFVYYVNHYLRIL